MKQSILTFLTRTPLHVGAGTSIGVVDQLVVRERHTRFPVIPGSGIKGVLRDLFGGSGPESDAAFGNNDQAGSLFIGEGKLLAFPVRSAKGGFAWLTCPLALSRAARDCGFTYAVADIKLADDQAWVTEESELMLGIKVIFEEYPLLVSGKQLGPVLAAFQGLSDDETWKMLPKKLAVVSDEFFQHFAENACEIAQHIRIDDTTGIVADGALFNQENVPSEALFYAVINAKSDVSLGALAAKLDGAGNILQMGANASTGLGWCSTKLLK
ncbi:MAG: type III-B CRISPR module RAMP protein Cmr4 [Kiritimatiellaeota bacterium]|nr:type III-B CRISPR module RAMP protein Cmr4 [Kiritimatiellota bacterium]